MRIGCQIGMWKGDMSFRQKIAAIGGTDASGAEVFVDHLKPFYDEPELLKATFDAAGLALSGAYFNSRRFLDAGAADGVVAEAAEACRFLREVGGEFLLLNGGLFKGDADRTFSDEEFAHLAGLFNRIGAEAGEIGISVVMHPHQKCQVETPADVDRLAASSTPTPTRSTRSTPPTSATRTWAIPTPTRRPPCSARARLTRSG